MMKSIGEVSQMILDGKVMVLAGSEKALMQLPKGNWIGGTIPYFMTDEGGSLLENKIQTTILPDEVTGFNIQMYDSNTISTLPQNYFPNGFTIIIMPALTAIHQHFAKDCSTWN